MKIAVVGGGVSGIVSAHLLSSAHDVTLFESNSYLGGHTNTLPVTINGQTDYVDTGFIVYNEHNYPGFVTFLNDLGVETQASDMSFGFFDPESNFYYSSLGAKGYFAQKKNAINLNHIKMISEIKRFNQLGHDFLSTSSHQDLILKDFIIQSNFSDYFLTRYLLPMGAAIWSCSYEDIMNFPARAFLSFWQNHQLLTLGQRPTWRTIKGGSFRYVEAFKSKFNGELLLNTPVDKIIRNDNGVVIQTKQGDSLAFDYVVIATHADRVLSLLDSPTELEMSLFSKWRYSLNYVVLHTDTSILPPSRNAWASWNYILNAKDQANASVTYHMNRLQSLSLSSDLLVTLNPAAPIDPDLVINQLTYTHPLFTIDALKTQAQIKSLSHVKQTSFCGSYMGFGFHEDAVQSAITVARNFGISF